MRKDPSKMFNGISHAQFESQFGTLAPEGSLRCSGCGDVHEANKENFPRLEFKERICKTCLNLQHATAKNRRKEKEQSEAAQLATKMISAITTGKKLVNAPHITEFLDVLIRKIGGTEQFADRYLDNLHAAETAKKGSPLVMKAYEHITKLILYSTQYRSTAPDVAELNDNELAERLRGAVEAMLDEDQARNILKVYRDEIASDESDAASA